jgi:hypothetical protein
MGNYFDPATAIGMIFLKEEVPGRIRYVLTGESDQTVSKWRNMQCSVVAYGGAEVE